MGLIVASVARRRNKFLALAVAAAPFSLSSVASADRYWGGSSGSWSSASWSTYSGGAATYGPPVLADNAYITNADAVSRTITLDESDTIASLQIGNTGGGVADTLSQTGAFNLSTSSEQVGTASGSVGAHTQSAGTNTYSGTLVVGSGINSTGVYNLSGTGSIGVLANGSGTLGMYVGYNGNGTFNQAGGFVTVAGGSSGNLLLGSGTISTGSYFLSGAASVSVAGSEIVGGSGTGNFSQSGGSNTVGIELDINTNANGAFNLSSGDSYTLSGGTLSAPIIYVGRSSGSQLSNFGTFTWSGGQLNTPTIVLSTNGSFVFDPPSTLTFAGSIYGRALYQQGTGTTTLTGSSNVQGIVVDTGTLSQAEGTDSAVGTPSASPSSGGLYVGAKSGDLATYVLASGSGLSSVVG